MIVERFTWTAKMGHRGEFIDVLKGWLELTGFAGRVCGSFMSGSWEVISWYQEFETIEDRNKLWEAIDWSRPEVIELRGIFEDLIESRTSEILRVL